MILAEGKSLQQVFEEIMHKLIKQGKRCIENHDCAYSDGEGNHCAVGWLLPDDLWDQTVAIEELVLLKEYRGTLGLNEAWIRENVVVLSCIQMLHDHYARKGRKNALGILEEKHGIKMPEWARQWLTMDVVE